MIIDTNKLTKAIDEYYDNLSEQIDNNTKDDMLAIKRLTHIETEYFKQIEKIEAIEILYNNFLKESENNT